MLKCANCQSRFLAKKSTKTTSVRISLKIDSKKKKKRHTFFPSCLQEIIEKYNNDNKCNVNLDEIDEDKLCEIIFGSEGMKVNVNYADNVRAVSFS